jgi:hypothetical protein
MNGPRDRRRIHRPVTKTIAPEQPGAVKWSRRYGDALVCVRHRRDADGRTRYITIELVVDAWPIRRPRGADPVVAVSLPIGESQLRARAMALGAQWDAAERVWHMKRSTAQQLGLQARIRAAGKMASGGHRE